MISLWPRPCRLQNKENSYNPRHMYKNLLVYNKVTSFIGLPTFSTLVRSFFALETLVITKYVEIFLSLPMLMKIFSTVDSWAIKSYVFMVESFAGINQLIITFSMVKCNLKLNIVWSLTIRNELKLQVKKS
jgi:hypothetical protein